MVKDNNGYQVFPDRVRIAIIDCAYLIIIACLAGVLFIHTSWIWKAFAVLFIVLFGILAYQTLAPALSKRPLYVIDKNGVTDYTHKDEKVTVPWSQIQKIELAPNNASMEIGIIAMNVLTDKEKQAEAVKKNYSRNGNLAIYSIIIDGFKFRRKPFLRIYDELQKQGLKYNPKILVNKYRG